MDNNLIITLTKSPLFAGIQLHELEKMVNCLNPIIEESPKNTFLAIAGDQLESIGILLSGEAMIIKENAAGNRLVMAIVKTGDMFGEMAVFSANPYWPASVLAKEDSLVFFLSKDKILNQCEKVCNWHRMMIQNLLKIVTEKALMLNKKVEYLIIKSLRGKISAFLLDQAKSAKNNSFILPMNRNEMADFLNVSRPSMSREMGLMRREGIIDYHLAEIQIINPEKLKQGVE